MLRFGRRQAGREIQIVIRVFAMLSLPKCGLRVRICVAAGPRISARCICSVPSTYTGPNMMSCRVKNASF